MTREEQAEFVRGLCVSIASDTVAKLPKIPETEGWDGHELRVVLAERFSLSAEISEIKRRPRSRRARDYRNVVKTTTL